MIFNSGSKEIKFKLSNIKKNIEEDLIKWDSIKLHRTGTKGDNETAYWLADEINKCGLTAEIDTFNFIKRTPGKCEVKNRTLILQLDYPCLTVEALPRMELKARMDL